MNSLRNIMLGVFFLTVLFCMKPENHLIDISPAICKVTTTQKVVALTFDDGPRTPTTPDILSVLKDENVKATFFVVGEQVKRYPNLILQEIDEGHEVGVHTYSHPKLTKLKKEKIQAELDKTENELLALAPKPTLFRPPGGFFNSTVLKLARDNGYTLILWSIDTLDWRYPPVGAIVNTVLKGVKPGSIILLHDGKSPSSTPEAVKFIIEDLKARGYTFVTVSELLQYYEH